MRISIITPTIGRTSLKTLVDGARDQMDEYDQLIAVGDGEQPISREIMAHYQDPRLLYMEWGPTKTWGTAQVDYGMKHAAGDFIVFLGDDDEIEPDGLKHVRHSCKQQIPHLFAMYYGKDRIAPEITSGQQLVMPRYGELTDSIGLRLERPTWASTFPGKEKMHDRMYMKAVLDAWGKHVKVDKIVVRLHKRNYGEVF